MRRDAAEILDAQGLPALCAPAAQVVEALAPLVTAERLARIEAVAEARSRNVTVVLDRLYDPHNASAVMRSADAFGLLEVQMIEQDPATFGLSGRVTTGAERWLDVRRHASPSACLATLRDDGFEIYVASMDGAVSPEQLRGRPKVAVVFGNEHLGIDPLWRDQADGVYAIPMRGFVESLNVSVAAAITLHQVMNGRQGDLSAAEREALCARYLMASVRNPEAIVAEYRRRALQRPA